VTRYFDASALVKRYFREKGSVTVRRLLASGIAATSRLSEVEVSSGVIRRAREGAFSTRRRDRILAALQRDVPALAIVEMTPEVTADARGLLMRHVLRASDAVQLASCLYLQRQLAQPVPFVAFDSRLLQAARAEGLTIISGRTARQSNGSAGRILKRVPAQPRKSRGREEVPHR
jgi:predicted nucleic acid-binding protein